MAPDKNRPHPADIDGIVDEESVANRAGGRPPVERTSDDPGSQARAILEESEKRIAEGLHTSDPFG